MPAPYEKALHDLESAKTFEQITAIVDRFPATVARDGGALYSGAVGATHSSEFVTQFAGKTEIAIIDDTERARFLSNGNVKTALRDRAEHLFRQGGHGADESAKLAGDFLFGDGEVSKGPTSVENSQWGRASKEFVGSLKGDVVVLASNASPDRVFGRVELQAALENPKITSLGGIPTETLRERAAAAHGDLSGVLHDVQERFRGDVSRGAFLSEDDKLVLSREFAESYHLKGDFTPATELEANGLRRLELPPSALVSGLEHANVALNVALVGYDSVRVAKQYEALAASGNAFAANAMVRREALEAGVGFGGAVLASAGAGAAWGALGGAETGPGALITGAVGGVVGGFVGAVGGSELARKITESQVDHDVGADGNTYAFKNGSWQREHWLAADVPAPAAQIPMLEMHRTEKITDLAIANPPPNIPNGAQVAANAFVMDYYGKGWDKLAPLPQSVTTALGRPNESKIADATTGKTWEVVGTAATREEFRHAGRGGYEATIEASGDDLKRVLALRDRAVSSNREYGSELIGRAYDALHDRDDRAAIQSRLDELRKSDHLSLPDVAGVRPYRGGSQTGSFVKISDDAVAQHLGRGQYQVLDVNRDLHGVMPPEGKTMLLDTQGYVHDPHARSYAR